MSKVKADNKLKSQQETKTSAASDFNGKAPASTDGATPTRAKKSRGFISDTLMFNWIYPLIKKTQTAQLMLSDIQEEAQPELVEDKLKEVEDIMESQEEKDFIKALLWVYRYTFVKSICTKAYESFVQMTYPWIISEIVTFMKNKEDQDYTRVLQMLCLYSVLLSGQFIAGSQSWYNQCITWQYVQNIVVLLTVKKQIRLTASVSRNYEVGQIHSLRASVQKLGALLFEVPDLIIGPLWLAFCSLRLIRILGPVMYVGICLMVFCFYFDKYIHRLLTDKKHECLKLQEKRMNVTFEAFEYIRSIKMFGWENHFREKILAIRAEQILKEQWVQALLLMLSMVAKIVPSLLGPVCFSVYVYLGDQLDLVTSMEMIMLFGWVRVTFENLMRVRECVTDMLLSIGRIQSYLDQEEVEIEKIVQSSGPKDGDERDLAVCIKNKNFSWGLQTQDIDEMFEQLNRKIKGVKASDKSKEQLREELEKKMAKEAELKKQRKLSSVVCLKDIDLKIKKGSFVCIIGKVGSGKSSLLSALIGDLLPVPDHILKSYMGSEGFEKELSQKEVESFQSDLINHCQKLEKDDAPVRINGSIAYTQQSPWINSKTVRENIAFNKDFNYEKYVDTVQYCELERDLKTLKAGDQTEIGEKGVNLSGGQKARIGLARAVYSDKEIYLMDDPISALDVHVRKQIITNVYFGVLRDRTRVLVSHAIDFIDQADHIVLMDQGRIKAQGTYDELQNLEEFQELIKLNQVNNEMSSKKKKAADEGQAAAEEQSPTKVNAKIVFPSPLSLNEKKEKLFEFGNVENKEEGKILDDEKDEYAEVTMRTVERLLDYYGHWSRIAIYFVIEILGIYLRMKTSYMIGEWAEDKTKQEDSILFKSQMAKILSVVVFEAFCYMAKERIMRILIDKTMKQVHNDVVNSVINAPVNLFFDVTPNGSIMKRFGDDMNRIDYLANHLMRTTFSVFETTYILLLISYQSKWSLLVIVCMLGYSITVWNVASKSMRQALQIREKHEIPIQTHQSEIMYGTSTIRAFHAIDYVQDEEYEINNAHILAGSFMSATFEWFSTRTSCMCSLSTIFTGALCILNKYKGLDPILTAMVFQETIRLGGLVKETMNLVGQLETHMATVQKCFRLLDIPQEKLTQARVAKAWPTNGQVEFRNVDLMYRPNTQMVLNKLKVKINGGEKVGVIGRTGAGKSTTSLAMTRIVEIMGGAIEIDGVNISNISLQQVRESITIIPQDATLFKGTLRYNMDPFNSRGDDEIFGLLQKAGLVDMIMKKKQGEESRKKELDQLLKLERESSSATEQKEPTSTLDSLLNFQIHSGGSNLSSGEKQLICICRAILRQNKVIILDEATANIDIMTEQTIQKLIKESFKDNTVITIAHRLQTIIESDKVLVLDSGEVAEFDSPQVLLKNKDSHFTKLVSEMQFEQNS